MGRLHHGSATTTEVVRRAMQHSQESSRTLAQRYGINQKTVAKWKKRSSVGNQKTGPKEPRATVLSYGSCVQPDHLSKGALVWSTDGRFARRLKTLKSLTPYEFIRKCWTKEQDRFDLDPLHQMPGLNTFIRRGATANTKQATVAMKAGLKVRLL